MKPKITLTPDARASLKEATPEDMVSYLATEYFLVTHNKPTKRVDLVREIFVTAHFQLGSPITTRGVHKWVRLMQERGDLLFDELERTFTLANYPEE